MPVVLHISDLHFGAHHDQLAESFLSDALEQRPDLVVLSGDLTQRARRRQFHAARTFIDGIPGPVLTVIGNHDLPLINVPWRLAAGTRRYKRTIEPQLSPSVTLPGVVAFGLDSMPAWRWKAGRVSPRQAAKVLEAFHGVPSDAWRLMPARRDRFTCCSRATPTCP
jgi:3',5'-cyclic AMP phosphodiesterase CpdA